MVMTKNFTVKSMYGFETKKSLVSVITPSGEEIILTPYKARDLALNLLQGAEASIQDKFLLDYYATRVGLREAGQILYDFRLWRENVVTSRKQKEQDLTDLYTALLIQASAVVALWKTYNIYDPTLSMLINALDNTLKTIKDRT